MMAAGLPGTATRHAQSVTNMAFDMREIIEKKGVTREAGVDAALEVFVMINLITEIWYCM